MKFVDKEEKGPDRILRKRGMEADQKDRAKGLCEGSKR